VVSTEVHETGGQGGLAKWVGRELTDRVDSVSFVGVTFPFTKEAVAHVRAAVVTAHFALLPKTHMALVVGIEANAICVPPAVLKLSHSRVEREVTTLALEVACLWKKRAELALAVCLRATLAQDVKLLPRQLRLPFFVGFLHGGGGKRRAEGYFLLDNEQTALLQNSTGPRQARTWYGYLEKSTE